MVADEREYNGGKAAKKRQLNHESHEYTKEERMLAADERG